MEVSVKSYKLAFVILHYCAIKDTIECVDSIKSRIDTDNYEIVIVDNYSPDNSGSQLEAKYLQDTKITVLLNDSNRGFAQGNNRGFLFAKNDLRSDFIVMLNNDTLLIQDDFFNVIIKEYEISSFSVLGPYIITPKEPYDDNPGRNYILTQNQLDKYIWKIKIHQFFNYLRVESVLNLLLHRTKKALNRGESDSIQSKISKRCENVQLHGCCWVFSPVYIHLFDGLDSRTFLYKEEEILFTQMMKRGLKTVYNPDLKIYHKEDASTTAIESKPYMKRRFVYKHLLLSTKVLKEVINEQQGYDT